MERLLHYYFRKSFVEIVFSLLRVFWRKKASKISWPLLFIYYTDYAYWHWLKKLFTKTLKEEKNFFFVCTRGTNNIFFVVSSRFLQCNKKININVQIICLTFVGENSSVVQRTEIQMPKLPPAPFAPFRLNSPSLPTLTVNEFRSFLSPVSGTDRTPFIHSLTFKF